MIIFVSTFILKKAAMSRFWAISGVFILKYSVFSDLLFSFLFALGLSGFVITYVLLTYLFHCDIIKALLLFS